MTFVKQHAFILACATGAVIGIALTAFGMTRGSTVMQKLQEAQQLAREFDRFRKPDSDRAVDQMDRQLRKLRDAEQALLAEAALINRRDPLVPDLFPTPTDDSLKYDFQDAYRKEIDRWLTDLRAAGKLSREELNDWKRMIEAEKNARRKGETPRSLLNVDPALLQQIPEGTLNNHAARAAVWQARHAYCYAEPASFDVRASIYQPRDSSPPAMDALWLAQTGLWIQKDIVDALIETNNDRAEELRQVGEDPWIGNLPVKQIVGIRITDYLFEDDHPPETEYRPLEGLHKKRGFSISADVGLPEGDVALVLTGHGGTDEFDVMHVRVMIVVDPRTVPAIIDDILGRNLFTLLNVRYRHVPISTAHTGLLYGPDPVIQLELDFAFHWLADVYIQLMPDKIKELLGLLDGEQQ